MKLVNELSLEDLLYTLGKNLTTNGDDLNSWIWSKLINATVESDEEDMIVIGYNTEHNEGRRIVELDKTTLPFTYYCAKSNQSENEESNYTERIILLDNLETLKQLMIKDLDCNNTQKMLVLFEGEFLNYREVFVFDDGTVRYPTLNYRRAIGLWGVPGSISHSIEFNLYFVIVKGEEPQYFTDAWKAEQYINYIVSDNKEVRVYKDGKQLELETNYIECGQDDKLKRVKIVERINQ